MNATKPYPLTEAGLRYYAARWIEARTQDLVASGVGRQDAEAQAKREGAMRLEDALSKYRTYPVITYAS